MTLPEVTNGELASAVPSRQSLRRLAARSPSVLPRAERLGRDCLRVLLSLVIAWCVVGSACFAQLYDSLDAYPPRWFLAESDCNARVTSHTNRSAGGIDGRGCESITFAAGQGGTEVLLVYPIEPVRPLDDLTTNVAVMSARRGTRVGLRVRFPYLESAETGRPVSVIVYGDSYNRTGEFRSLEVEKIERPLAMKKVALKKEHGVAADLSEPYVDAVILNAYSGPGRTSLRIDELRIDGMLELGRRGVQRPRRADEEYAGRNREITQDRSGARRSGERRSGSGRARAFPVGRVTRMLQHNGEPLEWVRTLGFDAVLLSRPPDAAILREAIRAQVKLYAPPPSAPDPEIEALLEPVAGWYLGTGTALDRDGVEPIARRSAQLRRWPVRWQRPLVGSPVEAYREHTRSLDAVIDHLPPRNRGLSGEEEIHELLRTAKRLPEGVQHALGVASMPAEALLRQTNAIADQIGASSLTRFRWHSMWATTLRSLETTPAAILFRSTRSLTAATPLEAQRGMAMSYTNRMIAAIEPWVAGATQATPPSLTGADYRCGRLRSGGADLLVLTSATSRGSEVLAGDGQALELQLSPRESSKTFWRLTDFSAERLLPETDERGSRIQIVSPDVVELVLMSDDPSVGGRAGSQTGRFARQAALDRWQLTGESVAETQAEWTLAAAAGLATDRSSVDLSQVAQRTFREAEPLFRSGDFGASLRMARRADAWGLRSRWRLAEQLMPDWPHPTSVPPMDCGAAEIQISWFPLMDDRGWGRNRLTAGALEDPEDLQDGRWEIGKRLVDRADSHTSITQRGAFSGRGALQARVVALTDDGLPGGYEGTAIQVRSPGVRVPRGAAVRIDAMVRTVGFGQPHQGLLVYDTVGGQESGVLVRGRATWTPVRLYRQTLDDAPLHVMFELIGGGEATIDEVQLRVWEPDNAPSPTLRSIEPINADRPTE